MYLISHVAVAVIQSIPIFDETKLFSILLPKAVGTSISFSYFLYVYLALMFLGKSPDKIWITHIFEQILCSDVSVFLLSTIWVLLYPPQDFLSTSAIFTSRGRDVSASRRRKQIELHYQQHSSSTFAACLSLAIIFEMILINHAPVNSVLVFVMKKFIFFSKACLLSVNWFNLWPTWTRWCNI